MNGEPKILLYMNGSLQEKSIKFIRERNKLSLSDLRRSITERRRKKMEDEEQS